MGFFSFSIFLFFFFPFFLSFFFPPSLWVERWGDRQGKSEQWSPCWCCLQSPRPRIPRSGPSRHKGLQRKSAAAAASESTRARLGLWHRQESKKKLGEARKEGKRRGEMCPVVFFQACHRGLCFRASVPGRGKRREDGGCGAMPPGSSLKSVGSPLSPAERGWIWREGGRDVLGRNMPANRLPVGTVAGPGRNAAPGAHLSEHVGRGVPARP